MSIGTPARKTILDALADGQWHGGAELRERLAITRQALNRHLRGLREEGLILQDGHTRGARYRLPSDDDTNEERVFRRTLRLEGAQEDRVFEQAALFLSLRSALTDHVHAIVAYAFQEMLNNAIDHSRSPTARVHMVVTREQVRFTIRDQGVGVFASIARRFDLRDEEEALGLLIKGKCTTQPDRHSGEGLFFTSRVADRFTLASHAVELTFDRLRNDVHARHIRRLKGTRVDFAIARRSRLRLERVFSEYAPERHDFQFSKTRVLVRLYPREYLSRSEARRLLAGLERFKEVDLDFSRVEGMGQAFADEVFRVFAQQHPGVTLHASHANPAVRAMIRHVHPITT